jgi:hypothetical protein
VSESECRRLSRAGPAVRGRHHCRSVQRPPSRLSSCRVRPAGECRIGMMDTGRDATWPHLTSHGLLHLREHERGTSHHASVNEGRRTTRSRTAQPTTVHEECMTRSLKTVGGLEEGGTHGRHGKGAAIDRHPTKNAWPQLVSTIHSFHPFFFTPGRANATIAGGWPSCSIPSVRSTVVSSVP